MKLWEIKASALRLMFADTDFEFNEDEFREQAVYHNPNTREKLVRMEDSIRRAIDLYYKYAGQISSFETLELRNENDKFFNEIDLSNIIDMDYPTRVDILLGHRIFEQVNFMYNPIKKYIYFTDGNYAIYEENISFRVWYKIKTKNLPMNANEMEFDLDEIISEDVQRMIPYYIKGELFEEDEPNLAMAARNEYMLFLNRMKRQFTNVQTKIKRAEIFNR